MSYYNAGDVQHFTTMDAEDLEDVQLDDSTLHANYNEWLDESYGDAEIAGMVYSTSHVLAEIDPTAYRTGFSDWLDREIQDGNIVEL